LPLNLLPAENRATAGRIGEVRLTSESDERIGDSYTEKSKLLGVSAEEGICQPKGDIGKNPGRYKILRTGYLAYNPMRINIGSIGVLRDGEQFGITSPDYVVFFCNPGLLAEYVYHYLRSEAGQHAINQKTEGSVRFRLYYEQLSSIEIPLPAETDVQKMFATGCDRLEMLRKRVAEAGLSVSDCLSTATRAAFLRP
jgi:type I restriction enzyme M protein